MTLRLGLSSVSWWLVPGQAWEYHRNDAVFLSVCPIPVHSMCPTSWDISTHTASDWGRWIHHLLGSLSSPISHLLRRLWTPCHKSFCAPFTLSTTMQYPPLWWGKEGKRKEGKVVRKRLKFILIISLQVGFFFPLSKLEILDIEDRNWYYINFIFTVLYKLTCMQ